MDHNQQTTSSTLATSKYENSFQWYKAILFLPCIGFFLNILFLIFLTKHKIGNATTSFILRLQAFNDAMIAVFSLIIVLETRFWSTNIFAIDCFFCYMWHTQFTYWYVVHIGVYIMLMTVLERFFCIVWPFAYKKRKKKHVIVPLIIVAFLGIFHIGAMFLEAGMIPDPSNSTIKRCFASFDYYVITNPSLGFIRKLFAVDWFLFDYALPSILVVSLYSKIIYTLRKSNKNTEDTRKSASMRFTMATMLGSLMMFMSTSYDAISYLMIVFKIIQLDYLNPATNNMGIILSSVNATASPFIYMIIMPTFRHFVVKVLSIKGRLLFCKSKNEEESTQDMNIESKDERSIKKSSKNKVISANNTKTCEIEDESEINDTLMEKIRRFSAEVISNRKNNVYEVNYENVHRF